MILDYNILLGWLAEPDTRPSFTELVTRLSEMLKDPLRYILTTTDGAVDDYSKLPSNIHLTGDCTYENNPFLSSIHQSDQLNGSASYPSSGYGREGNRDLSATFDVVSVDKKILLGYFSPKGCLPFRH